MKSISGGGAAKSYIFRVIAIARALLREAGAFRRFARLSPEERKENLHIPKRFVVSLLELGPTFVKLGQILSTRPDLIPMEYIDELKVLHESVPPFAFSEVKRIIGEEFSRPMEEMFASFEEEPVAGGSLAQVHMATLADGTKVAVKIQRPAMRELIRSDLRILSLFVNIYSGLFRRAARNLNLQAVFSEFKHYTYKEIDFFNEGRILERFRKNFERWPDVNFPAVFWGHTSSRVLTMEAVSGLRLHEVPNVLSADKRKILNERLVEMEMKMFISDAFFHADLHPGNIFFGEDGTINIIDVGMYGELTPELRDRFVLYWLPIVRKQKQRAFHHITEIAEKTDRADEAAYYNKFSELLDEFYNSDISGRSLTKTFLQVIMAGARHGFRFPSELLLQAKALTTAESLAFVLVPDFRFAEDARPIIVKEVAARAAVNQVERRLERTLPEWLLLGELPPKSPLGDDEGDFRELWSEVARVWAKEYDERPTCGKEVEHGGYTVEINENIEKVFNFVTRFAQYAHWHPTYTERSRVIHVDGDYVFLTPEVVGSVFQIDEIADGIRVKSNGEVVEFERNRMFKWRSPLSFFPGLFIGTCFILTAIDKGRTRLHEHFYYIDDPLIEFFISRKMLGSKEALDNHIEEELTGVKKIIEERRCFPEDFEFLWENINEVTRIFPDRTAYRETLRGLAGKV